MFAADVGAGEAKLVTQEVAQQESWLNVSLEPLAVDGGHHGDDLLVGFAQIILQPPLLALRPRAVLSR